MSAALASPRPLRGLERLVWRAPFGLKLWDLAERQVAGEGLRLRLFPLPATASPPQPGRLAEPLTPRPNRSGIFVLHRLPGIPKGAEADSPPVRRSFRLAVSDPADRIQRFALDLTLPVPDGLVDLPCAEALAEPAGSPPEPGAEPAVPVFPTPARVVPAGQAALRAELQDSGGGPAAFAVLEVRHAGLLLGRGLAGADGRVLVVFPYPEPQPAGDSPPRPVPILRQEWLLEITVRYRRSLPVLTPDPGGPAFPELCAALRQPPATLHEAGSPPRVVTEASLGFGRETVLRSAGGDPVLLVTPSGA
jgi:hypothetical protein